MLSRLNNGGGFLNHCFFWSILKLNTKYDEKDELHKFIKLYFGDLENFKNQFSLQSQKLFGSGWTWLILDFENNLKIISTSNQDVALSLGHVLLGIDLGREMMPNYE
ncbi:Fe-Mn family superoxide dismutase [Candidatus Phytoplasma palmae]|uniref:Fe-Mn family superoxide dismutase n=1 Tax=Candidatus Phytoplasma palmae TaxID=85624 RepID=UPI003990B09E